MTPTQAVSSERSSASGLEHNASPSNIPTIKICSLIYLLLQLRTDESGFGHATSDLGVELLVAIS